MQVNKHNMTKETGTTSPVSFCLVINHGNLYRQSLL